MLPESWHVPFISKFNAQDSNDCVNVVFLQRVSDEEHLQIAESLNDVDEDWISTLDVSRPKSRTLVTKRWIRDYWPSSDVILEIARHAHYTDGVHEKSYQSLIFVDSGWEAGNVIAARWEGEEDHLRLNAVRIRMSIAKALLTACDLNEGYTMAKILGDEAFGDANVNFYIDGNPSSEDMATSAAEEYKIPDCLPQDIVLSNESVTIIALRHLTQVGIEDLVRGVMSLHDEDLTPPIKIHNWHGSYVPRSEIRRLFYAIQRNSNKTNRDIPLFLVDALLEEHDGRPQIICASESTDWRQKTVQLMPIKTYKLLELWECAREGSLEDCFTETVEYADIWNAEYVFDLGVHKSFEQMRGAPVFFLEQFGLEQERRVRAKLRELNEIEDDEDWGKDWTYFGYIWRDGGQSHKIEELRDLFETCDPFSPTYISAKPGPYRLLTYPSHFIAVDHRIFDPKPKVWLASSLDFHLDDVGDQLGWTYGLIDAKDAHLAWVNLDIANMGPEEQIDEPLQLWLSDVKEARKEWEDLRAEDFA